MKDTDIEQQQQLHARLHALESEHRDLDEVIERLADDKPFDQLQLQRLRDLNVAGHKKYPAVPSSRVGNAWVAAKVVTIIAQTDKMRRHVSHRSRYRTALTLLAALR